MHQSDSRCCLNYPQLVSCRTVDLADGSTRAVLRPVRVQKYVLGVGGGEAGVWGLCTQRVCRGQSPRRGSVGEVPQKLRY